MGSLKHLCDGVGSVWCFFMKQENFGNCIIVGEIDSFERDRITGMKLEEIYLKEVLVINFMDREKMNGRYLYSVNHNILQDAYFVDVESLTGRALFNTYYPNHCILVEDVLTHMHLVDPSKTDEEEEEEVIDEGTEEVVEDKADDEDLARAMRP